MSAGRQPDACALSCAAGHRVWRLRRERGWTVDMLAGDAGISHSMLVFLEGGRRNFTLPVLEKIARALEVQPWELLKPQDGERP